MLTQRDDGGGLRGGGSQAAGAVVREFCYLIEEGSPQTRRQGGVADVLF